MQREWPKVGHFLNLYTDLNLKCRSSASEYSQYRKRLLFLPIAGNDLAMALGFCGFSPGRNLPTDLLDGEVVFLIICYASCPLWGALPLLTLVTLLLLWHFAFPLISVIESSQFDFYPHHLLEDLQAVLPVLVYYSLPQIVPQHCREEETWLKSSDSSSSSLKL